MDTFINHAIAEKINNRIKIKIEQTEQLKTLYGIIEVKKLKNKKTQPIKETDNELTVDDV